MTETEELEKVWCFGTTHSRGWRDSDNPCVRGPSKTKVWETWQKAKVKAKQWYKKEKKEYSVENFIAKVEGTIRAQALMRKEERRAGKFMSDPVGLCVYLNESRWDVDDMGSHSELKEKKKMCVASKPKTSEKIKETYQTVVKSQVADMKRILK